MLKFSKDGIGYYERIKVDAWKGFETSQVREASTGKDAGYTIYDYQRNLAMTRVPEAKACFLSQSTENVPRAADLIQLLNLLSKANVKMTPQTAENFKIVGKLHNRSSLSKEMVNLCANLPIYRVAKENVNDSEQISDKKDADVAETPGKDSVKE